MNFATLRSLAIPEGNVTQITIGGVTVWVSSKPVKLQVKKITSDTYAAETTYTGEQFILLDIYPKSADSVVKVTYGGITKTLTFSGTNSMPVYFGTFNGVSDSVATPESGTLTISGDYLAFSVGTYSGNNKNIPTPCGCITGVDDFGDLKFIVSSAFYSCAELTLSSLPSSITSVAMSAFYQCKSLQFNDNFFSNGLVTICDTAFTYANVEETLFTFNITIPETVTSIGKNAFAGNSTQSGDYTYFKRVRVLPKTPPVAGNEIFGQIAPNYPFSIVVPKGCGDAYKAAEGWSNYADYITEEA